MSVFQGQDGEMRIISAGTGGTTLHLQVLFCEMDFSGPIGIPKREETLIMDRGVYSSDAHMIDHGDDPRYAPVDISFTCRLADTINTQTLNNLLSGSTIVSGITYTLTSWKNVEASIDGNVLPDFADTSKMAYRVEIIWDGDGTDFGLRYNEVYFPPMEQTISEGADTLTLAASGKVYGGVSAITPQAARSMVEYLLLQLLCLVLLLYRITKN